MAMLATTVVEAPGGFTKILAAEPNAQDAKTQNARDEAPKVNELSLAGLQPGNDNLALARKRYGDMHQIPSNDKSVLIWENSCAHETLRVEADDSGVIQFVTAQAVATQGGEHPGKCSEKSATSVRSTLWRTGHGLAIGDDKARVVQIYGQPGSDGPSTGEHREGELMYYAFDWAGSDVPQVLEVYCDRATSRVVEITLSAPSL